MTRDQKYKAFQTLHTRPGAFVIPNPWDAGSAKLLSSLGFEALATDVPAGARGYVFTGRRPPAG